LFLLLNGSSLRGADLAVLLVRKGDCCDGFAVFGCGIAMVGRDGGEYWKGFWVLLLLLLFILILGGFQKVAGASEQLKRV